jgi:hypothetical protein
MDESPETNPDELPEKQKALIRKYMLTTVAIPGVALTILAAIAGYYVKSFQTLAERQAYMDAYASVSDLVVTYAASASAAAASGELLLQGINREAESLDQLRRNIEASAAIVQADSLVADIVRDLSDQPGFQERVASVAFPVNMIAFFSSPVCPDGWTRADEMRGRYAVGVDPNNREYVGTRVGIELAHLENRPAGDHGHAYVNTVPVHNGGRDTLMGGGRSGFNDLTRTTTTSTDQDGQALVEGTNAPYVLLTACRSPRR